MTITALIVDDSPFTRKIIRYHLMKLPCKVVGEAENPPQALKLFHEYKPELVTLDLMMPKVGELDSMAVFRATKEEAPDVAIVVVSVIPFEKVRDSFIKQGVFDYIVKPFNQFSLEPVRLKLARRFPQLASVERDE